MQKVDNESYFYMYNGHADVVALIDANTGDIAATYYYYAFGNLLDSTGNVNNHVSRRQLGSFQSYWNFNNYVI